MTTKEEKTDEAVEAPAEIPEVVVALADDHVEHASRKAYKAEQKELARPWNKQASPAKPVKDQEPEAAAKEAADALKTEVTRPWNLGQGITAEEAIEAVEAATATPTGKEG